MPATYLQGLCSCSMTYHLPRAARPKPMGGTWKEEPRKEGRRAGLWMLGLLLLHCTRIRELCIRGGREGAAVPPSRDLRALCRVRLII
eukprot:1137947-Pelagomonas_calceolata.AAC.12